VTAVALFLEAVVPDIAFADFPVAFMTPDAPGT
jgi:hypothetical protein